MMVRQNDWRTCWSRHPATNGRCLLFAAFVCGALAVSAQADEPLAETAALQWKGDIASRMIDGVDRFLLKKLDASVDRRDERWQRDFSSPEAFEASIAPNRKRLARMLGMRDPRVPFKSPQLVATTTESGPVGSSDTLDAYAIRWPVLADPDPNRDQVVVHGEGLLLMPRGREPLADVIAVPDADQTPEQISGLAEGLPDEAQYARRLAESGCRVLVPALVGRGVLERSVPGGGRARLTGREFVYRAAFELGRHVVGYEVQKVLALTDWLSNEAPDRKLGIVGYGEGGMLALYAGALDPRIDVVFVSGYFGPRETIWRQPIDRNVFGLLTEFGDAELAAMMAARTFLVDDALQPQVVLSGNGGAPAQIETFENQAVSAEFNRALDLVQPGTSYDFKFQTADGRAWPRDRLLAYFFQKLGGTDGLADLADPPQPTAAMVDPTSRQKRQIDEMDQFTQLLLRESPFVRRDFMQDLDTSSLEAFAKTVEPYRRTFREDVIGAFEEDVLPPAPRTRKAHETDKWTAYEVVLDVYPEVFAHGYLLLPNDLKRDGSERRPVVVCQHGLEGRPTDTFRGDHRAYHDFAAKLAERGLITFAPQNLYIFGDRFRTLQRKANPLGKTLFSIIVPQHQQIVDWLQSLPFVDPDRVAFYGLSYGGKTAMRVPALVTDYCLSICSADFNEWVLKNASTRHPFSYVWTGEYEIFEWDLGSTFNYAEMAGLICPRPFMVERGHFDGVGWDEYVAYEFAKVRHLYQAKLGIGDRCAIEWFVGPHTIHGQGTFDFLHRHLEWPKR